MVSARLFAQLFLASVALSSDLFVRQPDHSKQRVNTTSAQCTSDDACKSPCSAPAIRAKGVNVTASEAVQAEAERRFGDAHCQEGKCSCAITSDDEAQDFCKYWIENDKDDFKGARYVNGGVDADKGGIYCVYASDRKSKEPA